MSPILRRILQLFLMVAAQAILLFVSAGSMRWSAAWWYLGLFIGMLVVSSFVMIPHHSEVIAERGRGAQGGKRWDLWIMRLIVIPSFGILLLAGLDERFSWTPSLPLWAFMLGVLLFITGYLVILWAMYINRYFSQIVRIQSERGHTVVTRGPYRVIRHPGTAGMLITCLGCILLLDTVYGLLMYPLYLSLLIIRTSLEDRALQAELPGYAEYAKRTRYQLLPGVW